ncbi:MAG: diacylglycerol kinase family protein [Thermacetogeniaceae bacterium]|jgi:diacylglycerol kinase (ATP)|nr:diacylglycerol kinase family protein [Thermoanaerobacterales bacterium]NLN21555.1 diacylglycerol kinase family protein [Syntrophomonadaceae bacterium]HAF17052.1 diacylglycerol kinase [Peptococcaceae bacterium]
MAERSFNESINDALSGIKHCLLTQRNIKIHLAAAVLVLLASWLLGLSRLEFAVVIFAIALVLTAEMFNTAVEEAIDLYVKTYSTGARLAKHVAAGAVLTAAICAVVIGLLIFVPHLYALL